MCTNVKKQEKIEIEKTTEEHIDRGMHIITTVKPQKTEINYS